MSAKPTDNLVIITGRIGKVEMTEAGNCHIRLCHKDGWWDEKKNQYVYEESWFSVTFFGKRAHAAFESIKMADLVQVEGSLIQWPKEGPESRTRINGKSFKIIYLHRTQTLGGGDREDETR